MDIIVFIAVLFIGVLAVTLVSGVITEDIIKDYGYTTITNSTEGQINLTGNATHTLNLTNAFVAISGKTADKTLTSIIENTNATANYTVTVYLEGVSLGTITALNGTNTTKTFTSVAWTEQAVNNLTYEASNNDSLLKVSSSAGKYPSSKISSSMGGIYDSIVTGTGQMYMVLIAAGVITVIGVILLVIKNFGARTGGAV